jgi:hypothetical protein
VEIGWQAGLYTCVDAQRQMTEISSLFRGFLARIVTQELCDSLVGAALVSANDQRPRANDSFGNWQPATRNYRIRI